MRSLSVSEWCCAIRFNKNGNSILNDIKSPFTVIKDSYRYWTADPFLFKKDDEYFLFFEMFDRLKRKGLLGCRKVSEKSIGKMHIIYECDHHMSYPFIYEENETIYIIPECAESGELFRLKCIDFPYKWEKDIVYTKDHLVDTTPFDYNGKRYYFSERVIKPHTFDRLDVFYESENNLVELSSGNPVKTDFSTARCAGKLFKYGDMLIRPSQDCSETYGSKLNFNRIVKLSANEYDEELLTTVTADSIILNSDKNYNGIHTYNSLDNIEVIDLKKRNFNLLNIAGAIMKRIF